MECLSGFFAALIGSYLVISSLAALLNIQRAKKIASEFLGDHPLLTFSGGISTILGLILVLGHNVWIAGWPVLITLIGWWLLIQGICRLFCPDHFVRAFKNVILARFVVWCWIWLLIGLYLFWMGFASRG